MPLEKEGTFTALPDTVTGQAYRLGPEREGGEGYGWMRIRPRCCDKVGFSGILAMKVQVNGELTWADGTFVVEK